MSNQYEIKEMGKMDFKEYLQEVTDLSFDKWYARNFKTRRIKRMILKRAKKGYQDYYIRFLGSFDEPMVNRYESIIVKRLRKQLPHLNIEYLARIKTISISWEASGYDKDI